MDTGEIPDKLLLRRRDLRGWLGLTDRQITKMIAAGKLRPKHFTGAEGRAHFVRNEVIEMLEREQASRTTAKKVRRID